MFTEGIPSDFNFDSVDVILSPASPTVTPTLDGATVYDTSNNKVGNTFLDGPVGSLAVAPDTELTVDADQAVKLFEIETINAASLTITSDTLAEEVSRINSLHAHVVC